jgi:hypothetical protein
LCRYACACEYRRATQDVWIAHSPFVFVHIFLTSKHIPSIPPILPEINRA